MSDVMTVWLFAYSPLAPPSTLSITLKTADLDGSNCIPACIAIGLSDFGGFGGAD